MDSKQPRAFVTQESPKFDYSTLERHGAPVFVTSRDFANNSQSMVNEDILYQIREKMKEFDPEVDFFVPSGSPMITAVCMMALRDKGITKFSILRWSNRDISYKLFVINYPLTH